jgi:hypothetical protein
MPNDMPADTILKLMMLGGIAMASLIIGLLFIRFWKTTGDRFFLFFAAAFFIAGAGRVIMGLIPHITDHSPLIYLTQLLAFLVIIYAIVDKNRSQKRKG